VSPHAGQTDEGFTAPAIARRANHSPSAADVARARARRARQIASAQNSNFASRINMIGSISSGAKKFHFCFS
jgi:hypothetical protein